MVKTFLGVKMLSKPLIAFCAGLLLTAVFVSPCAAAKVKRNLGPRPFMINARSALLIDMTDGKVLYEQNPDALIAPASITKVLTLFVVFDAIREGHLRLWDTVQVSSRAACTSGSRMGLHAGDVVTVEELIKGAAVVSGNDACVALAEHLCGDVNEFVRRMNIKARTLGMRSSLFLTPNGLPAKGQVTTASDIARLSMSYLMRFPESLNIHSMTSYTYRTSTHRNANRLLGTCPGVDGLKTGFVCAAGYNLAATAKRGDVRLLGVVLGAPSAGVRAGESKRLLEYGFQKVGQTPPVEVLEVRREPATGGMKLAEDDDQPCPVGPGKTSLKSGSKGPGTAWQAQRRTSKSRAPLRVVHKPTTSKTVTAKAVKAVRALPANGRTAAVSKVSVATPKNTGSKSPAVAVKAAPTPRSSVPVAKNSKGAASPSKGAKAMPATTKQQTTEPPKQSATGSSSGSKKSPVAAKSGSPPASTGATRGKSG